MAAMWLSSLLEKDKVFLTKREQRCLGQVMPTTCHYFLGTTGFIGRENSEISLDKVSRFTREFELAGEHFYASTIIIDKIGTNSRVGELARDIEGHIIQMSEGYWPQKVARLLKREFGYDSPLANMNQKEVRKFLDDRLLSAPLNTFLSLEANDPS